MSTSIKILTVLAVAAGVGVGGHYALRNYLRSAVRKELENNKGLAAAYEFEKLTSAATLGTFKLNLPPIEALVESVVPMDSFISPYDAADDIGKNGRFSQYWPKAYKRGSIDPTVEKNILVIFSNIAAAGKKKELGG